MTDLERVMDLFIHLNIPFKQLPQTQLETNICLIVEVNDETVKGHFGFYTEWIFDRDGKFISKGIWE